MSSRLNTAGKRSSNANGTGPTYRWPEFAIFIALVTFWAAMITAGHTGYGTVHFALVAAVVELILVIATEKGKAAARG